MSRRMGLLSGAIILAGILIGQAVSQEAPPRRQGQGNRDPGQFRQRMMERIRETLKATDEEWKVLEPKIEKVQSLQMQLRSGMRMFAPRAGQAQDGEQPTSDVEKKGSELKKLLDDPATKPEAVKTALKALRDAREKTKGDLTEAQKDLRGVVNLRQESYLVLVGMLE
jgi:predicted RNase H-like nuclease (RuvC/YqgF family)